MHTSLHRTFVSTEEQNVPKIAKNGEEQRSQSEIKRSGGGCIQVCAGHLFLGKNKTIQKSQRKGGAKITEGKSMKQSMKQKEDATHSNTEPLEIT